MLSRKFYLFRFDHLFVNFDKISRKHYSFLSANFIRQTFIDYFGKENHYYIKSSPVRPFNDTSLEFVNAGMNQFKNVFLGLEGIPVPRAVNSQKCIRVGGKHNDLNSVGKDTYHHTFFEMLGNWSFNDYFKVEACKLAWNLITSKPFVIDPNRLYVTYFKGDNSLNLLPDLETKEIWKEIGVAKDRILPFGLKENFWEMGLRGPCGPCTEIHYDHLGTKSRPHLVNKDSPDLTELWNNVFIQFNRLEDGSLVPLEKHFVDTGMGLERLVALLQGKSSNYDTDIFAPYFSAISKISGFPQYSGNFGNTDEKGLDTGYRILADHSRMISVAIADNIFPDESHGLRRVIRKGLLVAEKFLPGNGVHLMVELSKIAGETFSQIFPEVSNNLRQVEYVLRDENELWEEIKSKNKIDWENLIKDNPCLESLSDVQSTGLISSFKVLKQQNVPVQSVLPGELCLVLYDRYGLNPQVIEELGRVLGYSVDMSQLEKDILILREKNKALIHSNEQLDLPRNTLEYIVNNFSTTDDSFKTAYYKDSNGYCFEKVRCKVQAIVKNGHCVDNISSILSPETSVIVLLEKTNMWSLLKGGGDTGDIKLFDSENNKIGTIHVNRTFNLGGYVYHVGKAQMSQEYACVPVETLIAEISIDHKNRLDLMRNTSAVHLLSLALREKFICNMQSYRTSNKNFSANFLMYGHLLHYDDIRSLEERINSLINAELNIEMTRLSTSDLVGSGNLYLPPYVRPNMNFVQLVNIHLNGVKSCKEVTIGPNVLNTKDIERVCFLNIEDKNRGRNLTMSGISGQNIVTAMKDAKSMLSIVEEETDIKTKVSKLNSFMMESPIPLELKSDFLSKIQELKSEIKQKQRGERIEYIKKSITEAKAMCQEYVVLYVGKETRLERLLQLCMDLPIMLFASNGNYFSARCHVPKGLSTLKAEDWMNNVANKLGGQCVVSKEQDSATFVMRPIKLKKNELKSMIKKSEIIAKSEAESLLLKI